MAKINSTIFKTFNNDIDGLTSKIGLFNKSFHTMQRDLKAGNGVFTSIFGGKSITSNDIKSIQAMNNAMKGGATYAQAWQTHMKGATVAAKQQAAQCIKNKGSLTELTQGMKSATVASKAAAVGMNLLATAGNMIAFMAISKGIELLVNAIDEYIHAAEIAREKSSELTDSWVEENSSIDDSISKYKELREKLQDTSLTASEVKDVKEELLVVQQDLIDKYGQEALGIDLVNGKYDEQIAKLKELSKQKAQDYVAENYSNIQEDEKYVNEKVNLNTSLGFKGTQARPDDYSGSGFDLGKYLERYDKLDAKVVNPDGQYGMSGTVNLVTSGTREEVYNQLSQLFNDLSNDFGESNEDVNKFKETLSGIIQDSFDTEQMEKSKDNIKKYAEAQILSQDDTRKLYEEAALAVDKYNEALVSDKGIDEAKANLDSVKESVTSATSDISGASYVFDDIYSGINSTAEKAHEITKAFENNTSVKEYAEQLKGLSSDDLLKIDFEDNVTQAGEEAFTALMDIIGLSEDEVQALIDKLIELGYVQGSTLDNEITDSFASIFNSSDFSEQKQSLIDLAKAGELTNKALSSDDYSDFIDKLGEIGISAEEAKTEILSLLDATEKLSGASKSISGLENAYNEFKEKGYVLAETIESIPDVFRELETYDFDVFENIIGNPKANNDEIQDAFNDIVTAYISEMAVLSDVSEAEAQRFISNLEEMGVTNADTVVNSVLALNDSMKATAKEAESTAQEINDFLVNVKGKAASATNDLTNCTWSEINALIEEGNKFGYTTSKIEEFALQKLYANRCNLDVNDDITGLVMLAETLGICSEAVASYKQIVELAKQGYGGGYGQAEAEAKRLTEKIRKEIEALYTPKYTPTVSYKAPTSSSSSSTSSSKETEKTAETFDWIEKLLERIQSRIDSLDKTASSTYKSWAKRNKALLKQLSEVNTEINAQQKAYDTYMAKANSVGLSEHYKQLVQNGGYSIEDITDDTLKNKISEYEEWYNKAMDCSDAIDDLKNNILELTTTQFENVFNEYEDSLSGYRHQIEMLQTYIDQTEAKGYVVSGNYYKQLIETEKLNIKMLQDEYAKLKDSLQLSVDTGKIVAYSDAWYDMVDNIRNVQKSIEDANTSLIEYQTTLRELEWESFDRFMDKISKIKDESDFLIELMSDKDMFNEDGITDEGQATLGLHAINYNVYLSKAEEYAKKLKDINEEIANDPNNQTLLERRQELLELQQESILAAEDEKQAMKDLVSEGYDVFLESLQKIIDKRKDMLKDIKDLHDFEKSIAQQTSEISKLEKILKAYEGDNSEEARAKIQEYKVSLEEAKENLEETEYDKYIQDQEQMLDNLYSQAEEFVNQRLDDLSQLVSEVIDSTNENASDINSTIKESADDVGYTISSKLANAFNSASNGVADLVSDYNDNFLETMTTLQTTVDDIRSLIAGESNSDNLQNGDKYNSDEKELSSPQDRWTKDENNNWNYYENGEQVKDAWTKYEKDDKWYHLGDSGVMDTNTWIKNKSGTWSYVDGTGAAVTGWHKLDWQGNQDWYNFDVEGNMHENQWIDDYFVAKSGKMLTNTWIGHNGKYYWVGADGKWLDKEGWSLDTKPLDGLPLYEYAKGSKRIPEDQLALVGEKGQEVQLDSSEGVLKVVGKGDMVFTNEASRKLWEFSQDPEGYMAKLGISNLKPVEFAMPSISSMMDIPNIDKVSMVQNVSFDFGDIQMYGVNNTEEFAKQLRNTITTDTKTQKLLTEKIGSSFLGRTDRSNFYR